MVEKLRSVDELVSKGTYVMYISLRRRRRLRVGSLGEQDFDRGVFAYIGSARGPGGLRGRLKRHMRLKRGATSRHWHIDYVLSEPDSEILGFHVIGRASEHLVAREVKKLARATIHGFGCSDCRCSSHFFYLGTGNGVPKRVEGALRACKQISSISFIGPG